MLLKAPADCGGFSTNGNSYIPDNNGCIDCAETDVTEALSHGFAPFDDSADPQSLVDFSKLTKKQLLAFAQENLGLELAADDTNKSLIAQIEAALEATTTPDE